MSEIYKIIGYREFDEGLKQEYEEFLTEDSEEAKQIKGGYTNPLTVANIVRCRAKCLKGALNV
jgi:hypothetical protein